MQLAKLYDHIRQKARTHGNAEAEELERSLSLYIRQAWPIIDPADYLHNWHIDCIAEHLEAVTLGQIRRLLINIPPRYMKSIETTVCWPTWVWTKQAALKWIFTSYADSLSTKHSLDRRKILQSDWYRKLWGDRFYLLSDQNVKDYYVNNHNGEMYSTSIGGAVTGHGGDVIVVDDPHDPRRAESEAFRNAAIEYFRTTLPTRLNNKKAGAIVVVMQRLHEQDVSGYILSSGAEYTHLKLPAEVHKRIIIHFPVSGREVIREPGSLLWPEREGPDEIAAIKKELGSYAYSGQYDQEPTPSEGGIFKRWWWRFWCKPGQQLPPVEVRMPDGEYRKIYAEPLPERFDEQLQSWDLAFKGSDGSDFVCGQAWGRHQANKYLLDQMKDRMDIIKTMQAIVSMTNKFPRASVKLVEDKANGPAVIQMLRRKVGGLIAVEPDGGKEARAHAVAPEVESGNVYLPHPHLAPWVEPLINTFAGFPKVANDDEVDAATQAIKRMMYRFIPAVDPDLPAGFYTDEELKDLGYRKNQIRKVK